MAQQSENLDFDSMPQDELIRWLDKLSRPPDAAKTRSQAQSDTDWGELLDDDLDAETPSLTAPPSQLIEEDDDETPTALSALDEGVNDDTTDPLTWQDAGSNVAPLPADLDDALEELGGLAAVAELEDPLEWLESLANQIDAAADAADENEAEPLAADDPDDDDESLFSARMDGDDSLPDALPDLPLDADAFGTQSLAPLPDFIEAEAHPPEASARDSRDGDGSSAPPLDQFTGALLMEDRLSELEAWYADRLRALDAAATAESAPLPPLAVPPPGLAAGFNSARGQLEAGNLPGALAEYETLLRANIGLDLVVSDMRWLLSQARFRDEPAVHRVLGDALMRQGQLQEALDTYRYAMSLLER